MDFNSISNYLSIIKGYISKYIRMKEELQAIKDMAKDIALLYVEDNVGLRTNMEKLLSKIFNNIILAEDGEAGYKSFVKLKPKIVITDINMPNMHGFKMIQKINATEPDCKVIILSAYDEKQHLHTAIDLGVFRYLHKPAKTPELILAIYDALKAINEDENRRLFYSQMSSIFNYQNNIVVMMHEGEFVLCNQRFLEFFEVDDLEDFKEKHADINDLLLEHKEFLYSLPEQTWYDVVANNPQKLFHTKVNNSKGEPRHLILKSRTIPEKENHYVLSFDDITELNLMSLFDSETARNDMVLQEKESIRSLMQVIQNNSSEVKVHNFYKGLTIVNPAVISKINENEVTMKTVYPQLKIVNMTKFMTITSEIFPKDVVCKAIKTVDMDNQSISFTEMSFAKNSVTSRKYIRLEPDEKYSFTLFYKDIKLPGKIQIIDISEVSVKIGIDVLPAGMVVDTEVKISFTLNLNGKLISITTDATIYRVDEDMKNFFIVMLFELSSKNLHEVKEYLAARQMALIREFKRIDIM